MHTCEFDNTSNMKQNSLQQDRTEVPQHNRCNEEKSTRSILADERNNIPKSMQMQT
jgi:hypothetical protein